MDSFFQGLLQKYKDKFQAEEFLEGSEAALENFQETLYSLDKEVLSSIKDDLNKIHEGKMSIEGEDDPMESGKRNDVNELLKRVQMSQEKIDQLNGVLAPHSDWKAKAEEDPDSLYGQFYRMVSDQLMEACKNQFMESVRHCFLLKVPRMDYELGSGKIQNVSFLGFFFSFLIFMSILECDDFILKLLKDLQSYAILTPTFRLHC